MDIPQQYASLRNEYDFWGSTLERKKQLIEKFRLNEKVIEAMKNCVRECGNLQLTQKAVI